MKWSYKIITTNIIQILNHTFLMSYYVIFDSNC